MERKSTISAGRSGRTSLMRRFLDSEAAGGIVLMGVTVVALAVANSPLARLYFAALNAYVGWASRSCTGSTTA